MHRCILLPNGIWNGQHNFFHFNFFCFCLDCCTLTLYIKHDKKETRIEYAYPFSIHKKRRIGEQTRLWLAFIQSIENYEIKLYETVSVHCTSFLNDHKNSQQKNHICMFVFGVWCVPVYSFYRTNFTWFVCRLIVFIVTACVLVCVCVCKILICQILDISVLNYIVIK